jgi:outer membrane protein assembly factor BamD
MKRRLGLFLAILMGFAVMVGYAFQEQPQTLNQYPGYPKARQRLREILQRFPESDFAPTVQQLLKRAEEKLALGDFEMAQFYADRGNYVGAMSRLKTIIDEYPNFSRIDEVNKLYESLLPSPSPQENTK